MFRPVTPLALCLLAAAFDAAAAYPPVTGDIACTVEAGTLAIKPGLATTPGARAGKLKIKVAASDTTCDSSGAAGGRFPIAGVAMKVIALIPEGSFCTDPPVAPLLTGKVKLQFKGFGPTGKLRTVVVNKTTIDEQLRGGTLRFGVLTPVQTEDAFADEAFSIVVSPQVLSGLCTDVEPLTGSTLTGSVTSTSSSCDAAWIGDGRCDAGCNSLAMAYDGGDCCPGTCQPGGTYACGFAGYSCLGAL